MAVSSGEVYLSSASTPKLSSSTAQKSTRWRRLACTLSAFLPAASSSSLRALRTALLRSPMRPIQSAPAQVDSVVSRMNGSAFAPQ